MEAGPVNSLSTKDTKLHKGNMGQPLCNFVSSVVQDLVLYFLSLISTEAFVFSHMIFSVQLFPF